MGDGLRAAALCFAMTNTLETNGIDMFFEADGEGEPLLLLHGFTGCGRDWQYVFKERPQGYRTITPDLRGHGRSTNPSNRFTHRQAALDVFALLDHLGVDRCRAIGLSCGAKTLLHMATEQPSRIEAMVLVSAAPYFPEQARAFMRRATVESHTEDEWQIMRQRHVRGDDQIRALWTQGNDFKDSYHDMNFTPPLLSTITARTLIVSGDRDFLYPAHLALELYQAIPRSYLWVVPNGTHGPIFGDLAPAFVETAGAFLRGDWDRATGS
jgi:pimeloyl-ACP methyl ester carboxylesterase